MALDITSFDPGASSKGAPNIHRYVSTADAVGTIEGASYFTYSKLGNVMKDEDLIYYVGTDGNKLAAVSNSGTAITLKAPTLFS